MLYDRARIEVRAGAGGDGCVSFRREAHVPRGGPDGGDGGRGGDVVLICDESLRDLHALERNPHVRAPRARHGEGALRHGADGDELLIAVPPGTEAEGLDGDLAGRRFELMRHGQRARLARGGLGGRGNKHFATPSRQAPRFAERGLPGEQGAVSLQLRLLADVGLIGLPNAGKSSLLSRLTRAAPKVAAYPFTTLQPVLGVLESEEGQLVIADIPGLIEGASEGAGLGHDFLSHVERCQLLVHVLDVAPSLTGAEHADPLVNHRTIERELAAHDQRLAALPRVLALSKVDLLDAPRVEQAVARWSERLGDVPVIATSSATGAGLAELKAELTHRLPAARKLSAAAPGSPGAGTGGTPGEQLAEHILYRPGERSGFSVKRTGPGCFAVRGVGIERLVRRFDASNEEAMDYLESRLRRIGVIAALEDEGFQPGDEIEVAGTVFELDPGEA